MQRGKWNLHNNVGRLFHVIVNHLIHCVHLVLVDGNSIRNKPGHIENTEMGSGRPRQLDAKNLSGEVLLSFAFPAPNAHILG